MISISEKLRDSANIIISLFTIQESVRIQLEVFENKDNFFSFNFMVSMNFT